MQDLKLGYFDVDGGRAEPIRLALHIGNIAFEDHRFSFGDFAEERKKTPLGQVPVLSIDGATVTQSNAILRYIGKQANLYPDELYQALLCDEVMDAAEDCTSKIVATFSLTGDALKMAREKLVNEDLTKYLKFFESKLVIQKGEFFADQRITIADLKIVTLISWINSGTLDHVPTSLVAAVAPKLNQHAQRMAKDKSVSSYYLKRK